MVSRAARQPSFQSRDSTCMRPRVCCSIHTQKTLQRQMQMHGRVPSTPVHARTHDPGVQGRHALMFALPRVLENVDGRHANGVTVPTKQ